MTKDEIEQWHKKHPYGARDDAYMDAVLERVKQLWKLHPHERLGQLLYNDSAGGEVYYVLDEEWSE